MSLLSLIIAWGGWREKKRKKREGNAPGKGQEGWVREEGKGNYSRESRKKTEKGWHMGKFRNERKEENKNLRRRCFRHEQ